jgi:hypothetical protein
VISNKKILFRKEKKHTLKTQLVVDRKTMKIIYLNFCNGKNRLFKESKVHRCKKGLQNQKEVPEAE